MTTKWATPLFLSALSFMVNTQNVCAMCRQGQEQSSSGAFQTNFTVKNSSKPTSLTNNKLTNNPIDSLEYLLSKWDTLLNETQQQVKASKEDFQLFSNFNRSYLDSEWAALFQLIKCRKINYRNIASYLNSPGKRLQSLYSNFVQIKEQFPSSLEAFQNPSVSPPLPVGCNPACTNMDFSAGNFTGWSGFYAVNNSTTSAHVFTGITGGSLGPVVRGSRDPATSNTYQVHITSRANNDWFLRNYHAISMSQASPWGSGYSAMIGDSINNGKGISVLSQEFQVTPTTNSVTYAYSVFLENPAHNYYQQPFFSVTLFDQNGDTIRNCGVYNVVSGPNIPGFVGEYYPPDNNETVGGAGGDTIYWRPWTQVNVPLNAYVGQCVTVQFEVGDCALGGHCGYAYVDASCSTFTITAASPVICGNGTDVLTGPAGESHYSWTGPANSILTDDTLQRITIDSGGTYTLIITPVTGGLCKDTLTITIPRDLIAVTATATNIDCNGGVGSATATATNGMGAYTYSWSPSGGTNATATGLSAGNYTVTVTDTNGCPVTAMVTLTQPAALISSSTILSNETCNGDNDGSAIATVSGGTSPYNYLWNPSGQTNATATGLSALTYTLTVSDAHGCTASSTAVISQPTVLSASTATTSNVSCTGGANGSASVTASGGTVPYGYLWNPSGGTNATATGLSAGTYTVTVTDAHGCTASLTAVITQPLLALSASTATLSNVSCTGGANGSASVTATGGTSPYNYLWSPSRQTNATATGLSAGTYTVTVTDAHGCTASSTAVVSQPLLAISATAATLSNVSCTGGVNGSASATASGGTSPYNYLWSPSGGTNATATGLSAGIYTVTVTDAHRCTASSTAIITQPLLAVSAMAATLSNVSCAGGANGSASVTASGGTSPYYYLWSPSRQTNTIATGLSAGTYTVTVTDAHGCRTTATTAIIQPLFTLSAITTARSNISCNGDANGSASVIASGGTSPYYYLWNPSGQTTTTATGLSAGTYTVTVTDAHGCSDNRTISITQPLPVSLYIAGSQRPVCKGQPLSISADASGGTLPYVYSWSTGNTTSSITITPLSTKTYTVSIIDANGCSATATITITISSLLATTGQDVPICSGESTNLIVNVSGGSGNYSYKWFPGNDATPSITVMPTITTTYTVIITDGCSSTDTAYETVVVNPLPNALFRSDINAGCAPLCVQFRNSSTISSAGSIVQWNWDFGDGANENSESPIHCYTKPGTYDVVLTITSNSGCSSSLTKTKYIKVYGTPAAAFDPNPQPTTISNPVIQFTNQTNDKDSIVSWLWNFGASGDSNTSNAIDPFHRYADTGTYRATLMVMSNHGCTDSVAHDVVIGPNFTLFFPNAFTPNGDGLNEVFFAKGTYVKDFEMYIYDRWGMKLFHTTNINEGWDGKVNGSICQEDVYVYVATASDVSGNTHQFAGRVTLLK